MKKLFDKMISKGNWTKQEDQFLRQHGNREGKKSWVEISQKLKDNFPNKIRSPKQCRERFINHASIQQRKINYNDWNENEIVQLFTVFEQIGPKWSIIAEKINGKTENSVKNKFYGCVRKFVRKLNKVQEDLKGKNCSKLKYQSVFRILNASNSIKGLKYDLKQKSLDIKKKIVESIINKNFQKEQFKFLLDQIYKFNRDSRNYKEQKKKIHRRDVIKVNELHYKHNANFNVPKIIQKNTTNLYENTNLEQERQSKINLQGCSVLKSSSSFDIVNQTLFEKTLKQNQLNGEEFFSNLLLDDQSMPFIISSEHRIFQIDVQSGLELTYRL